MEDNSRRRFLKYLLAFGTLGISSIISFKKNEGFPIGKVNGWNVGMTEASGKCGMGMDCAGGGGKCGMGMDCAGGGGKCGMGMDCAGGQGDSGKRRVRDSGSGSGKCGMGMDCAGGGGKCGMGMDCAGN